jgi:hypothetical protein
LELYHLCEGSVVYRDLRPGLQALGFKPKNLSPLVTILTLGNLKFLEVGAEDVLL